MPYRQVRVDSLLRSMTDTGVLDTLQEKQAHTGPESAAKYFIFKMNIQPIFFSQKRLVENPRHARTEWSQLET